MAAKHPDFVMGFISVRPSQWKTEWSKGLVQMTPGVQLGGGGDVLGQQYNTPDRVIKVRLITPVAPVTLCNTRQTNSYFSPRLPPPSSASIKLRCVSCAQSARGASAALESD